MSTYVISDLHGQYKIFTALLEKAAFSDEDRLIMLGDAIDRGPDGIKILQHVMDAPNMEFLLGNHEFMMLNAVSQDGRITLDPWNLPGRDASLWYFYNGGNATYSRYRRLRKPQRQKLLEWLSTRALTTRVEVGERTFILTHSFFDMDKVDVPYSEIGYGEVWDIVWQSPFRYDIYAPWENYYKYDPWTFVVGHVPVCLISESSGHRHIVDIDDSDAPARISDESPAHHRLASYRKANIIDIDGCCAHHDSFDASYKGGILLRLDDLQEFTISFAEMDQGDGGRGPKKTPGDGLRGAKDISRTKKETRRPKT